MTAWALGAREWREAAAIGAAGFYPLHEAWQEYEPVQLPGSLDVNVPGEGEVVDSFLAQVQLFQGDQVIR